MDPVTPNLLAGLGVEAVKGIAGRVRHHRLDALATKKLTEQVAGKTSSAILAILADMQRVATADEYDKVAHFLHTPDFKTISRTVAVTAILENEAGARPQIAEQLASVLCLMTGIPLDRSRLCSNSIVQIIAAQSTDAVARLKRVDPDEYSLIREQAAVEVSAGRLRSLKKQTETIEGMDPARLSTVLRFADDYARVVHAMTSDIVPAYFDTQKRVPIDAIYVAPLLQPDDPRGFGIVESDEALPPDETEGGHLEHGARYRAKPTVDLSTLLHRGYRLVVLGDPGAGKSTLGQRIVHGLTSQVPSSAPGQRIPFVVTLRRYEEHKRTRSSSLVEFLEDALKEDLHLSVPQGAVRFLFAMGKATVIFDGLDELLETHRRREITSTIESFAFAFPTVNVIVTSRVVGYREAPLNSKIYQVATLLGFDDSNVREYASKWFQLDDRLSTSEKAEVAKSFFIESQSVADLRSNPLMLGLLCNVYRGERSIPQNRAELYDQCARMLFERWDAGRGIRSTNVLKADARSALQGVALWVFSNQLIANGIPERSLRRKIAKHWMGERHESLERALDEADSLLASWRGRAWVLTDIGIGPTGERLYKFTHQTFLEYFASHELVRRNPSPRRLWKVLGARIASGEWDIVAQLSMQILDQNYGGAKSRLYEYICASSSPEYSFESRRNTLSFGARYLDALLPSPKACRRLVGCALELALEGQVSNYLAIDPKEIRKQSSEQVPAEDAMLPLLTALAAHTSVADIVVDEVVRYATAQLSSGRTSLSAAAYVFLGNISEFGLVLRETFDVDIVDKLDALAREALGRSDVSSTTIERIDEWCSVNFRAGLTAYSQGLVGFERVANNVPASAMYVDAPRLIHEDLYDETVRTIGHDLISTFLFPSAYPSQDPDDAYSALATLGSQFAASDPPFFGGRVYDMRELSRHIVKPYYRTDPNAADLPLREQSARAKAPRLDANVAFGAAVLLAAIIENENWRLLDESDDQVAFLDLGPLQMLEMLFAARLERGLYFAMRQAVERVGLSDRQRAVLLRWGDNKLDFTVASI